MNQDKSYAEIAHSTMKATEAPKAYAGVQAYNEANPEAMKPQKFLYQIVPEINFLVVVKNDDIHHLLTSLGITEVEGQAIDFTNPIRISSKGTGYARKAVEGVVEVAKEVASQQIRYFGTPAAIKAETKEIAQLIMSECFRVADQHIEPDTESGFRLEMCDIIQGDSRSLISGEYLKTVNLVMNIRMYAPVMLQERSLRNMLKFTRNVGAHGLKSRMSIVFDPSNFTVAPEFLALFNRAVEVDGYTVNVEQHDKELIVHFEQVEE